MIKRKNSLGRNVVISISQESNEYDLEESLEESNIPNKKGRQSKKPASSQKPETPHKNERCGMLNDLQPSQSDNSSGNSEEFAEEGEEENPL